MVFLTIGTFAPESRRNAYRQVFSGEVIVVEESYIINAESGKFLAYTDEHLKK